MSNDLAKRLRERATPSIVQPVDMQLQALLNEAAAALERKASQEEVLRYENARVRAMFDAAIGQLVAIKAMVHPDGFVINGKGYSFHPPIELVREAWEGMSKAIREIDTTAALEQREGWVPKERPCIHEWYQGTCAHCAMDAHTFRAMLSAAPAAPKEG